ncbi:hypothetical protein PtrSN002B_008668 [Pyrenophora tritici-repentis]|nr:hypothetical protein PtrV1_07050 [Pyrenophora tritici-repentis]KAF7448105.1 hypothetical protein A1F99_074690 [Pyrenophora tritici-repentis]KAF7571816.1 hypothetical protein PtrM4_093160 [Pyrenophora tritici-repentis]KAG9384989.1 hypothetical protein A1F94_004536 [Pyrenophora tritici-repentis]KAI0572761.1 hypothetical protein Alg215_09592 [Pyrenophora tritici-repentis]
MFFAKTLVTALLAIGAVNAAAVTNPVADAQLDKQNCEECHGVKVNHIDLVML